MNPRLDPTPRGVVGLDDKRGLGARPRRLGDVAHDGTWPLTTKALPDFSGRAHVREGSVIDE